MILFDVLLSVTTCSSIFCPLTGSAELSPLDFTVTVEEPLECFLTWLQLLPFSFLLSADLTLHDTYI